MNVGELIAALQKLDPRLSVYHGDRHEGYSETGKLEVARDIHRWKEPNVLAVYITDNYNDR